MMETHKLSQELDQTLLLRTGEQANVTVENFSGQVAFGEACFAFVQDYRGGR